jgi:outer membrane immunogenic protein
MKGRFVSGLLCTIAILCFFDLKAQVKPVIRLGIVASTFSSIGDIYDNDCISVSYVAGGAAIIPVKSIISIQPEINFLRKGRYDSEKISGIRIKTLQYVNYLQVPILLRLTPVSLTEGLKSKIFFNVGPYGSLLINAKNRVKTNGKTTTSDQKDSYKGSDLGLIIGSGVQFPIKRTNFQVDLRYDMGFTKVSEISDNYSTKALSLAIGILF